MRSRLFPGCLRAELDMADWFIAQIPRPTLLGGEANDFFDVRGLRETYAELQRLYAILGLEENVQLYVGPGTHGYHQGARENMYRFFNRHAGVAGSPEEPRMPVEQDEVLQVTPDGQVHLLGSRRTFDFTRDQASELAAKRSPRSGKSLSRAVRTHLALRNRKGAPHYRVMRARRIWGPSLVNRLRFCGRNGTRYCRHVTCRSQTRRPTIRFSYGNTRYVVRRASIGIERDPVGTIPGYSGGGRSFRARCAWCR